MSERHLIIAVHDSTDQLACAHIAESDEEAEEVARVASSIGPCWSFPLVDGELLQHWEAPEPEHYCGAHTVGRDNDEAIADLCNERGWDWSIRADVAADSVWGAEVRVTPNPNNPDAPDRSFVTYAVGGETAEDAIGRALAEMRRWIDEGDL